MEHISAEIDSFIKNHWKSHFMQSPQWSNLKSHWNREILLSRDKGGNIKGYMCLLIRKIPLINRTIMYSPRGPVADVDDGATYRDLITRAKEVAEKYNSYVLKIDPDIPADDEAYREMVTGMGFKIKGDTKNFEAIQPRFVFRLNIGNRSEDEVMAMFTQKTRYNIRLASRRGVKTRIGTMDDLPAFHQIMLETGIRDKFIVRSKEYFQQMLKAMGDDARLYLAFYNEQLIAGTIAIAYGNKCWYLYGASSNDHRNVMPNYLLQWEMIKWGLERNAEIYDFRGVSGDLDESNPLYGLYRFKKGFNGDFTEFIGELDYVFNPLIYRLMEVGERIFREVRGKLFLIRSRNG